MDIKEIGFGDFCTIEQKRYVGPNEFYGYKVVGRKKSNVWTDVPVDANNEKETLHDHLDDVVTVVCNNLDDRTVHQFRVSDLASVRKSQAVPEGFVLVPERNVHDHYIANHLKGTTCSVDVSELTSNDGDRIYGKLRSFDCLGSDGNTLIYDLESSNFNLVKTTGNTGDFVLVEKTKLMQIIGSAAIIEPITRGNPLMSKYKTELDFILSTVRAMIEAQEPAPLKLGDLVEPIDHRYTLASGCERYPYAYVVNTKPFQLISEEGDMYWCCTVEAGGYKLIKSNDQLPEAVSLRMIREGLLSPVETQEPTHD